MPIIQNSRQELFAQELAKGATATAAYVTAGFKPHPSNAGRLSKNEQVAARVEELQAIGAEKAGVTIQGIVDELAKIAMADITDAVEWGDAVAVLDPAGHTISAQGIALIASKDLSRRVSAAVSEVSQTKEGLKIKFHSKTAALELLGKHLGMFKEKVELTMPQFIERDKFDRAV